MLNNGLKLRQVRAIGDRGCVLLFLTTGAVAACMHAYAGS